MKEKWVLAGLLVLLLLLVAWNVRERFEPIAGIPIPADNDTENTRIFGFLKRVEQNYYNNKAKAENSAEKDRVKLKNLAVKSAASDFFPVIRSFFEKVYTPAKTITDLDVQKYLTDNPPTTSKIDFKGLLTAYFVNQYKNRRGTGTSTDSVTDASGNTTSYSDMLKDLNQTSGYGGVTPAGGTSSSPASVESGSGSSGSGSGSSGSGSGSSGSGSGGSGSGSGGSGSGSGSSGSGSGSSGSGSGSSGSGSGGSGANTTPAAASSTGGSSTSSFGPNSGGGGERRSQVFGPLFTSLGEGRAVPTEDSSKTNMYPELLGGGDVKKSTLVDGAGIVAPSKNWQLANDGSLPSSAGLGADEDSKYFPTSRSPGDMDVLPDPYRVSQMYSAANYSFKTEPVPFLTDFSAFQK